MIEANDVASINLLAGAPFVSGPFINTFNEATIDFLAARGAVRIGLPVELSAAAIATLARHNPVETEALVFGRQGLSLSMRCYHARAYGLTKDACQFVCERDPDGLAADQLDGKPLLVVNGTQTLSHGYAAAFEDLAPLRAAGVSHFRLSPQAIDMVKVATLFCAALDGRIAPAEAQAELGALIAPTPLVDGYMRGRAGMSFSGAAGRA
jgi:collagenase-like PrtC family protease